MRLVELTLEDFDSGVVAISLVDKPAIESDFLALSEDKVLLKVEDEEKRIVTGAILIPDLHILRVDKNGEPYNIFFSQETILQLSQKYLKDHNQAKVTVDHQFSIEGVTLTESWIKSDANLDKSVALGLDVPVGTWLGTFRVDNEDVWNDWIKTGRLRGFSIEADSLTRTETNNILMDAKEFIAEVKALLTPKKEEVEMTEEKTVEMATKEDHLELCAKLDTLTEALMKFVDAKEVELSEAPDGRNPQQDLPAEEYKEPKEEEEEALAPKEVEEIVEEEVKETVEMVAHTDSEEQTELKKEIKFDYKLTAAERIANALKFN